MKAELRGNSPSIPLQNPTLFPTPQPPIPRLSTLDGACIEKLLLHCAGALESNDVTLAQQVMWVLNNVASSTGDPNQRLASYFLRALLSKASSLCPSFKPTPSAPAAAPMSVTDLAGYVDLLPCHRFGFSASNSAILNSIQRLPRVHILDFTITHCMQWPTLIDALAKLPQGPPLLRISLLSWRPKVPPFLNVPIGEIGLRLANFAKFRDVPFEFNVVELQDHPHDSVVRRINSSIFDLRGDEALIVNCQNWLRYLPEQSNSNEISCRDRFLEMIHGLSPRLVTVVDEDCDLGGASGGLASRINTCFNYMWIPFDALETFLPKNSAQRIEYEGDIGQKIENIIGLEGFERIERLESGVKLCQRMGNKGFASVAFGEESVKEVKVLLDEHASGWGMKKDEDHMLVLTWKGHNTVYATAWVPRVQDWENSVYLGDNYSS